MIDIDKLLELEAQATPGPWALVVETAPLTLYLNDNYVQAERKEDIDLISAMRNSIKQLCAELKASREVISRVADVVEYGKELDMGSYDHFPIGEILSLETVLKTYEARRG